MTGNSEFEKWYKLLQEYAMQEGITEDDLKTCITGNNHIKYWKEWFDNGYTPQQTVYECFVDII